MQDMVKFDSPTKSQLCLKNSKTQNLTLMQDMVKFNGPKKSKLCLKISKEKYFIYLTLYNFIFQIDKKLVNFRFFGTP